MKLKYMFLLIFSLVPILVSISCQSETEPVTRSTLPVTRTIIPQSTVLPTSEETRSVEMTSDSVSTPSPTVIIASETATLTPTITIIPTIVAPTLTPLPTFEVEALDVAIAELVANPMNCDVPCWWGAIPNETTGFEVQQFLNLYQFTTYIKYEDEKPDFPSSIEVWVSFERDENRFDFRVFYGFTNNVLQGVYSERNLLLHDILERYGRPDEVWLETMDFEPPGGLPFRLNLVYLQAGLAVGYVVDGDIEDDVAAGCFTGEERGRLQINIPNEISNFMDFRWVFEVDRRYLPLEEATELTIEDFMQRFTDPTQPQCIETPTELWK